jgi:hypothetical protein
MWTSFPGGGIYIFSAGVLKLERYNGLPETVVAHTGGYAEFPFPKVTFLESLGNSDDH